VAPDAAEVVDDPESEVGPLATPDPTMDPVMRELVGEVVGGIEAVVPEAWAPVSVGCVGGAVVELPPLSPPADGVAVKIVVVVKVPLG